LARMARELGAPPDRVNAEMLVAWFGSHTEWKPETRRSSRAAARGFFRWAYKAKRIRDYSATSCPRCASPSPRLGQRPTTLGARHCWWPTRG
jgi:hypothetical protein